MFIANYRDSFSADLTVAFDPADPVATPSTPSTVNAGTADDPMLQALAAGVNALDQVSIAYNAPLGTVQYYQPSGGALPGLAGGEPQWRNTYGSGRIVPLAWWRRLY